jgi:predicted 3-demethylubiquinone-9 3-methyltransferase (glyoxalase superfamily)
MVSATQKSTPFFGKAEEDMNFQVSLFERSEMVSITRYGPERSRRRRRHCQASDLDAERPAVHVH